MVKIKVFCSKCQVETIHYCFDERQAKCRCAVCWGICDIGYNISRGLDVCKSKIPVYNYSKDLEVFIKAIIHRPQCGVLRDHTLARYGRGYRCDQCNAWDSSGGFIVPGDEYTVRQVTLNILYSLSLVLLILL